MYNFCRSSQSVVHKESAATTTTRQPTRMVGRAGGAGRRQRRVTPLVVLCWVLVMVFCCCLVVSASAEPREQQEPPSSISSSLRSEANTAAEETSSLSIWPFNKKNHSSPDNNSNNTNTSDSCAAQRSCELCNAERLCHWCGFDQSCHAIGSPHGCLRGASCSSDNSDDDKKKKNSTDDDADDNSCGAHHNCADCALSSKLCHWCAHDSACHEVGSVYGCVTGVNCYDNAHCRRAVPEKLPSDNFCWNCRDFWKLWQQRVGGVLHLAIILALAGGTLCCTTVGCCVVRAVKGAYDDLASLAVASVADDDEDGDEDELLTQPLLLDQQESSTTVRSRVDPPPSSMLEPEESSPAEEPATTITSTSTTIEEGGEIAQENQEMQQLLQEEGQSDAAPEDYVRMEAGDGDGDGAGVERNNNEPPVATVAASVTSSHRRRQRHSHHNRSSSRRRPPGRSMQRLYNACAFCYVLTTVLIGVLTYASIRFYPQQPPFSVCNDSVDWKKLVESVTALKVDAENELLASISNPNYLDVVLDSGNGTFAHGTDVIGTLEIPPTSIQSMAITDFLMVASFTPETWQALKIAKEFYQHTLVLNLSLDLYLRIPALLNYEFTVTIAQRMDFSDENQIDRSLCACPNWSDGSSNNTPTQLSAAVPQWLLQ